MVKIIDNYSLNEQLGSGAFSKVFKGHHLKTKKEVAVKMVQIEKIKEYPKLQEYIINEVNILTNLQHSPYIIQFYSMLRSAKNFYFVYEYCNGGTLETLIRSQPNNQLSKTQTLIYLKQILQAFKVLTANNIMHRDLKPQNIFIHNGILKLGDFGFCKHLQTSDEMSQTMLGSPIYMAPEVLRGQPYTNKADIWSLGVIIYRMLYGVVPYQSNSIAQLISQQNEKEVQLPKNIEVAILQQLLLRMLKKNPQERIQWTQIFNNYQITEAGEMLLKTNINKTNKPSNNIQLNVNPMKESYSSIEQFQQSPVKNSHSSFKSDSLVSNYPNNNLNKNVTNSQLNKKSNKPSEIQHSHSRTLLKLEQVNRDGSSDIRKSYGISKSPMRTTNSTNNPLNLKNRLQHHLKNHAKCIDINYIATFLVKSYQTLQSIVLTYLLSKYLQKDLINLQKSLQKDIQHHTSQQQYSHQQLSTYFQFNIIIEEQIITIKEHLTYLQQVIESYSISVSIVETMKMYYLNNLINSAKLQNIQELVIISQLIDYLEQGILVHKNTYEVLGKDQLIKKIRYKYKDNQTK